MNLRFIWHKCFIQRNVRSQFEKKRNWRQRECLTVRIFRSNTIYFNILFSFIMRDEWSSITIIYVQELSSTRLALPRVVRPVSCLNQELLTIPDHLMSPRAWVAFLLLVFFVLLSVLFVVCTIFFFSSIPFVLPVLFCPIISPRLYF